MEVFYQHIFNEVNGQDGWQYGGGASGYLWANGWTIHESGSPWSPNAFKALTGLTPGMEYTISAVLLPADWNGDTVTLSVDGFTQDVDATVNPQTVSLTFIATATTHTVRVSVNGYDGAVQSVSVEYDPNAGPEAPHRFRGWGMPLWM